MEEFISHIIHISMLIVSGSVFSLIYAERFDIFKDSWIKRIFKFELLKISIAQLRIRENDSGRKEIIFRLLVGLYFIIYFSIYLGILGIILGILLKLLIA